MTQEQRWTTLWKRLGAQGDASAVYNDLVARYSEPHRRTTRSNISDTASMNSSKAETLPQILTQ